MRAVSQEIQGRTRRRTSLFSGPNAFSVRNTIGLKGSENMKTPLTKERVKHHLTYHSWKYLMLVALSIMGWNLIYTTTAYRPPAEKIVDVYLCASYGDQEALDAYLENIRLTEMPDMEQMQSIFLAVASDDYYGTVQLATYIMAGEGDVYLLSKENFVNYAGQGALIDLEPYIHDGSLDTKDIDLSGGWRNNTELGEKHLYGIPAKAFTGMEQFALTGLEDMYWCVLVTGGNDVNAVKLLDILIRDFVPETAEASE